MISTDVQVDLVINKLSRKRYDFLSATGRIDKNQLYFISNDIYVRESDIALNYLSSTGEFTLSTPNKTRSVIIQGGSTPGPTPTINQDVFKTVSIIKPYSENRLFLDLIVSENNSFLSSVHIDSKTSRNYFLGYCLSAWETQSEEGFGVEYNNSPIAIRFRSILDDNQIATTQNTTFYLKYKWYSVLSNDRGIYENHYSDAYSTIVPTNTEVGANVADVVGKKEFINFSQKVFPASNTATKDESDYVQTYSDKYTSISSTMEDLDVIVLNDYDFSNCYRMDFTTYQTKDVKIKFMVDYGNGPEYVETMSINQNNNFIKDTKYVIAVQYDTITILSIKGKDVVEYMKDSTNSVTIRKWRD